MKFNKAILILGLLIIGLSLIVTIMGIFSNNGPGEYEFDSLYGKKVIIHGKGIYADNSHQEYLQAVPQDIVTLFIAIPVLIYALFQTLKGRIRGRILYLGTVGYFLITYSMYLFLVRYNKLFLVYVMLMSFSFFSFILTMLSFEHDKIQQYFKPRFPRRFIAVFLISCTSIIGLLWVSRIIPTIINGTIPPEIEHGTTLPVQAWDLAIYLPSIFVGAVFLVKQKSLGYLISSAATVTISLIMLALLAKGISLTLAGIAGTLPMIVMTGLFGAIAIVGTTLCQKNIQENI